MTTTVTASHGAKFIVERWTPGEDGGAWVNIEEGTLAPGVPLSRACGPGESIKVWTDPAADEDPGPA